MNFSTSEFLRRITLATSAPSLIYSAKKGGILIKKKNRGKFTEWCGGHVTQECIDKAKKSGNKKLIKRAVFAENARKWNKK